MNLYRVMVGLLMLSVVTTCVWCRTVKYPKTEPLNNALMRLRRSLNSDQEEAVLPVSHRRLEKMLEKAILKIIMGDLSSGDMLLLKSLNYSLEEILAIRERELARKMEQNLENLTKTKKVDKTMDKTMDKSTLENNDDEQETLDVDAYNKQAVYDYENLANKMEHELDAVTQPDYDKQVKKQPKLNNEQDNIHTEFDRAMEPHVVFKIRYDDLDLDPTALDKSNEPIEMILQTTKSNLMEYTSTTISNWPAQSSFQTLPDYSTELPLPYKLTTMVNTKETTNTVDQTTDSDYIVPTTEYTVPIRSQKIHETKNDSVPKRVSEYEGLEWVEDDVYRVIPDALNDDASVENQNDTTVDDDYHLLNSTEEMTNDDAGEQGDLAQGEFQAAVNNESATGNLTSYQQIALAHRQE